MSYYRDVYKNSPRWDGKESLDGKRVIVYACHGYGDIIQYARYFRYLKNCHLILHCPPQLHRLMLTVDGVNEVIDKFDPVLPPHDYNILSLSLPFLLNSIEAKVPYIKAEPISLENEFKVGIAWEGSTLHPDNNNRSCPLGYFRELPGKKFMLNTIIENEKLIEGSEDMELFSTERKDFFDTAALIASMDIIVSVDTAVLHLAGAMGKPCYGMLCYENDPRWHVTNWYPSIKFIRQPVLGAWKPAFDVLVKQPEFCTIQ
jgi:hypothetical protein